MRVSIIILCLFVGIILYILGFYISASTMGPGQPYVPLLAIICWVVGAVVAAYPIYVRTKRKKNNV